MALKKPLVIGGDYPFQNLATTDTLVLNPGLTSNPPISIPAGVAPSSPVDGDLWATSSGLFYRSAGATVALGGSPGMTWVDVVSTDVNPLVNNTGYIFSTGGTLRTATLPSSCPAGFSIYVVAEAGSVRIVSNGNIIDDVGSGNDLLLQDGESVLLVCKSTGNLEIAGSQVPGGGVTTAVYAVTSGVAEVDFGSFPGKSDTSLTITGQSGILATSKLSVQVVAQSTTDHSSDEHFLETIAVMAGDISAGVGFTIYAKNTNTLGMTRLYGKFKVHWQWS